MPTNTTRAASLPGIAARQRMGDPAPDRECGLAVGDRREGRLGPLLVHLAGLGRHHPPVAHPPAGHGAVGFLDQARLDAGHPQDRLGAGRPGQVGGRGGQTAQAADGPVLLQGAMPASRGAAGPVGWSSPAGCSAPPRPAGPIGGNPGGAVRWRPRTNPGGPAGPAAVMGATINDWAPSAPGLGLRRLPGRRRRSARPAVGSDQPAHRATQSAGRSRPLVWAVRQAAVWISPSGPTTSTRTGRRTRARRRRPPARRRCS